MKRKHFLTGTLAVLVALVCGGSSVRAQGNSGQTGGILTNKGDTWIEVKADGERTARRLLPRLIPAKRPLPSGPDRAMLAQFQTLAVGNRVQLVWVMDQALRVVQIAQVPPRGRSGELTGTVDETGRSWIDVVPDDEDAPIERYFPSWIEDEDGGTPDAAMLKTFGTLRAGDRVTLEWGYDGVKRALVLTKLAPPKDGKGVDDGKNVDE